MNKVAKFWILLLVVIVTLPHGGEVLASSESSTENPSTEIPYSEEREDSIKLVVFSDVPLDSTYSEAVYTLVNKGILNGYPDGTFGGNNTLSRAEFAAVICRLMGLNKPEQTNTTFSDVPYKHWASGYISKAQQNGYIAGYTNGNFGPEDRLTYEQTITVLVRVLGHEEVATQAGGYPSGYIQIAQNLGLTDNTDMVIGEPITRFTTAILLINTLQIMI